MSYYNRGKKSEQEFDNDGNPVKRFGLKSFEYHNKAGDEKGKIYGNIYIGKEGKQKYRLEIYEKNEENDKGQTHMVKVTKIIKKNYNNGKSADF